MYALPSLFQKDGREGFCAKKSTKLYFIYLFEVCSLLYTCDLLHEFM